MCVVTPSLVGKGGRDVCVHSVLLPHRHPACPSVLTHMFKQVTIVEPKPQYTVYRQLPKTIFPIVQTSSYF
eukprot:GDKH01005991.1.p2 GENE.GDKH01005991.1~~GDKH01005991.1.p2  ORF type:complete len:71 (+),score=0.31 GDKH01005991.1:195-407(+)